MDGVTALGLVCNIFQLVETGIKIGKQCKQVHDRGSLIELDQIEQWAREIADANEELKIVLPPPGSTLTASHKRIQKLAQDSLATTQKLKEILNEIKFDRSTRTRGSLAQICQKYFKRGKLDELRTQLQQMERQIDHTMVTDLHARAVTGSDRIEDKKSFADLRSGQQRIIREFVKDSTQKLSEVIKAIKQCEVSTTTQVVESEGNIHSHLDRIHLNDVNRHKVQRLLASLYFDSINERQNFVQQRVGDYGGTFRWIFEPNQAHGFHEWLLAGNDLYWISGKPGSGKSSLINYISEHLVPRKSGHSLLTKWASPAPLKILSFFFYRPATDPLQKSFDGLWRTLCYDMLKDDETLRNAVLADINAPKALQQHTATHIDHTSHWMTKDLERFFEYLVSITSAKVFILLDGLDESTEIHNEVSNTVFRLSKMHNVKVCCSSRPDELFNTSFRSSKNLKLQELTFEDIKSFADTKLKYAVAAPLAMDIVSRAEGVFLWAHLMVTSICRGIDEGEPLEDLHKWLADAPSDMNSLFAAMLERLHEPYTTKYPKAFIQYILIVPTEAWTTSLFELLLAECDPESLDKCLRGGSLTMDFIHQLSKNAEGFSSRVIARCAGLVEVTYDTILGSTRYDPYPSAISDGSHGSESDYSTLEKIAAMNVQFIHRTVFDFLKDNLDGKEFVASCSVPEDQAYLTLLRVNLARMYLDLDRDPQHQKIEHLRISSPSLEQSDSIYKVERLLVMLEHKTNIRTPYHMLTDCFFEKLISHNDLRPENPGITAKELIQDLALNIFQTQLPVQHAVWSSYALSHRLDSYFAARTLRLPPEQREEMTLLAWCREAPSCFSSTSGIRHTIRQHVDLLAKLEYGSEPSLIKPTKLVRGLMMRKHHAYIPIPETPNWMFILSVLLSILINAPCRGWRDCGCEPSEQDFVLLVREFIATFCCDEISPTQTFHLTIINSSFGFGFEGRHNFWVVPGQCSAGDSQLVIQCTVERLICLFLPGVGYPERGLSGVGILPFPTRWKPHQANRWLELEEARQSDLWRVQDGRFQLNLAYAFNLPEDQLGKLSHSEEGMLRKFHTGYGLDGTGCFSCWPNLSLW